ncbi:MAG: hypothetical protein NT090_11390, partial [Acidobacteria bacterium]|nr:hypothetical protein [Acidobacteriota bacterium]
PASAITFSFAVVAGTRIQGADEPRQSVSRVAFEPFDRAVPATEGMRTIRQRGVGATGIFTRAKGRRQAWIIRVTDIRVRRWQLAFK